MPRLKIIDGNKVWQIEDPVEAMLMIAQAKMRPFTKEDWFGFSGCETKDPMIGEVGEFTIVMDGNFLNIIHQDDMYGGTLFNLEFKQ